MKEIKEMKDSLYQNVIEPKMKEIKEMKDALYHKMLEPSLLSKIVSVALAATSLIYVLSFPCQLLCLDYSINSLTSREAFKTCTRSTFSQYGPHLVAQHHGFGGIVDTTTGGTKVIHSRDSDQ